MSDAEVVVRPSERSVHLGQDASFTCHARNVPSNVQYHWQVPYSILSSGRVKKSDGMVRILETTVDDNNTDVTCRVYDGRQLKGTGVGRLVVLAALPSTEAPSTTSARDATTKVGSTTISTPVPHSTQMFTTLKSTTPSPTPSTTIKHTTTLGVMTTSPSRMPNDPIQGLAQAGTIAPAVVGGLVFLTCVAVIGLFLMRRYRRASKDVEKGTPRDQQMYEFSTPTGTMDFHDGANADEENHNNKRYGNNCTNQDSLRTYSRGTPPDSITRYAKAVPRKDRIVHAGGHGTKPRRTPVLTLSMNSLYEETTPTFVVADPTSGQVDVLPYKAKGEKVEIVGRNVDCSETDGEEDQYVTLAQNSIPPDNDSI